MKKFYLLFLPLIVISCSREPLNGTLYVIKGNGDIARAAATEVYFLPYKTNEEFFNRLEETKANLNLKTFNSYLDQSCTTFNLSKEENLNNFYADISKFSKDCKVESLSIEENETPESLKQKIFQEEDRLKELAKENLDHLIIGPKGIFGKPDKKIEVTYDYDASAFGKAIIKNNTDFTITSGENVIGGFYEDQIVTQCGLKQITIQPGESIEVDLGACFPTVNRNKLQSKGAEVCKQPYKYGFTLCLDGFGPTSGKYSYSKDFDVSDVQLVNWQYLDSDRIEESEVVGLLESSTLSDLNIKLNESIIAINKAKECSQLSKSIYNLENLSCPTAFTTREDLILFKADASKQKIDLPIIPEKQAISILAFAVSNAFASTVTNIEGKFTFSEPPGNEFLIYAKYADSFNEIEWLMPVSSDLKNIELNNTNALNINSTR